ncbi:MAG: T9SS type A sorting domain-containing protein [Candidatus Neomarinimicrobiota bacterium]|jgi:hypothetical protein|nr:T9SS type A sorting domain-containing protein [Candidatus Neomarinimicrobiota bacterium]MDD3965769.1 T9SS type A sorting domain-containing protein [Candidatus Neomarinimicrobiota bacterium]MDX9780533.1 T9SS type A sorting domain-containing protein [bacterium]
MYKKSALFSCLMLLLPLIPAFSAVEFLGLEALQEADRVRLDWATSSETANQGFILERKSDSLAAWEALNDYLHNDDLRSPGSVSYRTDYSYIDSSVRVGECYHYRLSGVDIASNIGRLDSLCICLSGTGVKKLFPLDFAFEAFPNPFNPEVKLSFNNPGGKNIGIDIYSLRGERIMRFRSAGTGPENTLLIWNAAEFPAGVYLAVLKVDGFPATTQKLLYLK